MNDPFEINKASKKDKKAAANAVTAAGATTAGVGFVTSGIPKVPVNTDGVINRKPIEGSPKNPKNLVRAAKENKGALKAFHGGVTGFREKNHKAGIYGFKQKSTQNFFDGPPKNASEAFQHGRDHGKIEPEVRVLRHLKTARRAGQVATVGGAGVAAAGMKWKKEIEKRDNSERDGKLIGTGLAGAAISGGGGRVLRGQEKKWAAEAAQNIDDGAKIARKTGGRGGRHGMYPKVTDGDIARNPKVLRGGGHKGAIKVGELRGNAAQARHFAEAYGGTAKVVRSFTKPSLVVAGAGGASMAYDKNKHKFAKRQLDEQQIARKKKAQSKLSQASAGLGLAALGGTLLGTKGGQKALKVSYKRIAHKPIPEAMRSRPKPKSLDRSVTPLLATSAGVGALGSLNFASYTRAEADKKIKKSFNESGFGVVHD